MIFFMPLFAALFAASSAHAQRAAPQSTASPKNEPRPLVILRDMGKVAIDLIGRLRSDGFINDDSPLFDFRDQRVREAYEQAVKKSSPHATLRDTSSWKEIEAAVADHLNIYGPGALILVVGDPVRIYGAIPPLENKYRVRYISARPFALTMTDVRKSRKLYFQDSSDAGASSELKQRVERTVGVLKAVGYQDFQSFLADRGKKANPANLVVGVEQVGGASAYLRRGSFKSKENMALAQAIGDAIARARPSSVLLINENFDARKFTVDYAETDMKKFAEREKHELDDSVRFYRYDFSMEPWQVPLRRAKALGIPLAFESFADRNNGTEDEPLAEETTRAVPRAGQQALRPRTRRDILNDLAALDKIRTEVLVVWRNFTLPADSPDRAQAHATSERAVSDLTAITARNPDSVPILTGASLVAREIGKRNAAHRYINQAIAVKASNDWEQIRKRRHYDEVSDAYCVKADLLLSYDSKKAARAASEAIHLNPQNAAAYRLRATANSLLRAPQRAVSADYARAKEYAPSRINSGYADFYEDYSERLDISPFFQMLKEKRRNPFFSAAEFILLALFDVVSGIFAFKVYRDFKRKRREALRHQKDAEIAEVTQYWSPEACPPTKKLIQDALAVLANSPTGASVAKFIRENGITVEPILSSAAAGLYFPREKAIYLSQRVGPLPIGIVCVIAHEGLHAMQDMAWRMEPCIEKEHQAYFFHFAVYHELLDAGHETIEDGGMHQSYLRFCKQTLRMDFKEFSESVLSNCLGAYKADMAARQRNATLIERLQNKYDAWQGLRGMESIAQQLQRPRYLFQRLALARTAGIHSERQEWQQKWIAEHRTALARRIEEA